MDWAEIGLSFANVLVFIGVFLEVSEIKKGLRGKPQEIKVHDPGEAAYGLAYGERMPDVKPAEPASKETKREAFGWYLLMIGLLLEMALAPIASMHRSDADVATKQRIERVENELRELKSLAK